MVGRLGTAVLILSVACSSEQPSVNEEVAAIERGQVSDDYTAPSVTVLLAKATSRRKPTP